MTTSWNVNTGRSSCERAGIFPQGHGILLTGIYVYDLAAGSIYINPVRAVDGLHLADLVRWESSSPRFHRGDPQGLDHLGQLSRTRNGECGDRYRHKRSDGQWIWCLSRNTVFSRDEQGNDRSGRSSTSRNASAEEQLKALSQTLEQRWPNGPLWPSGGHRNYKLAAELTQAEERERRRVARVLHDHLQQLLVATQLALGRTVSKAQDSGLVAGIERARHLLAEAIEESRSLTAELSPPILYDRGLAAGLEWLGRQTEEILDG